MLSVHVLAGAKYVTYDCQSIFADSHLLTE